MALQPIAVAVLWGLCWPGMAGSQGVPTKTGPLPGAITNPGFEESLNGWEVAVYGAKPELRLDRTIVHGGRTSLFVSVAQPSDTALGQNVQLAPGHAYRLTGWVRTKGLDPMGSPVYGTFQVQGATDGRWLGTGACHRGDNDWTKVTIPFVAPNDGKARIAVFFVGFGKGVGQAWFDDLSLEEIDLAKSSITITRDPLVKANISPFQYGQFIEYLCDVVPGMWAEKLCDTSFEGLSPYMFTHIKETDNHERPWYPSGATNRSDWGRDASTQISGVKSLRIHVAGDPPAIVGTSQDGLAFAKGERLTFSCFMRIRDASGPATIQLHDKYGKVFATATVEPGDEWAKHKVALVPNAASDFATLSISFRGPGTLWLDNASLMPDDNIGGWRRDVVEALRALKPGLIRTGGSVIEEPSYGDFEWEYLVGDPDKRKPFRAWGGLQNPKAGLGEFVELCRAVKAEPLICVAFSRKTPQSAADMVEYFNGSVETPMGAKRAKDGHPKPYSVKYWQVGNERFGRDYDNGVAAFCEAMLKVDPSIKIAANYPTEGTVKNAGKLIHYLSPHHYGCDNLEWCKSDLANARRLIEEFAPGRDIRLAVTEWNTTAGDWPRRAMLWTLSNALACSRYHNLMHRNADLIEIACRSNLTNSFCSGILQTDNSRLYKTPTYYAQWLYANFAGTMPLRIDSELPLDVGLDVSATLSSHGDELIVFVVNDGLEAVSRAFDLSAFKVAAQGSEVWTLADNHNAGEPDVTNSFADPERVRPTKKALSLTSPTFSYRFPALSLTVLRLKLGR